MPEPLTRATPESQGVPTAAVRELIAALDGFDGFHGLVLVRHGHVIAEAQWAPFGADEAQHVYSISKSFTSSAVGFAIAEGLFGLDDRIVELFPESAPAVIDDKLANLRVRHLLSMTTGHVDDSMDAVFGAGDGDWVAAFLAVPIEHEPGTFFLYDTGASFVLSALVQRSTGERLLDYLRPRLLDPLGITGADWFQNPHGVDFGGFGMSVTTRDIAALGELYLRGGMWGDRQVLPQGWAEQATSAHADNSAFDPDGDWGQGYGFQFWRSTHGYRGDGAFGQYCLVLPEQDLVVAITGSILDMQVPLYPIWEGLLPSLTDGALPEHPDAAAAMRDEVTRLSVSAPAGARATATARRVDRMRFRLDENAHGLEAAGLHLDETATTLVLQVAGSDREVTVGFREWTRSEVELWPQEGPVFAARGGWTGERKFQARIVSVSSPLTLDVTLAFDGDAVVLTVREHVSFGPIVPLVLRGTRVE
jgi:CubicO group peptidase (beta-lactamase class C family)